MSGRVCGGTPQVGLIETGKLTLNVDDIIPWAEVLNWAQRSKLIGQWHWCSSLSASTFRRNVTDQLPHVPAAMS